MPKFIMFVHASSESEDGNMPTTEEFAEMTKFNTALIEAGALLTADGLQATKKAYRVNYSEDAPPEVSKGPFKLNDNLVSGFWMLKLDSIEEAVAWAKKVPFKANSVTVRQIMGPEDFGVSYTPELREKGEELRKKVESQHPDSKMNQ